MLSIHECPDGTNYAFRSLDRGYGRLALSVYSGGRLECLAERDEAPVWSE